MLAILCESYEETHSPGCYRSWYSSTRNYESVRRVCGTEIIAHYNLEISSSKETALHPVIFKDSTFSAYRYFEPSQKGEIAMWYHRSPKRKPPVFPKQDRYWLRSSDVKGILGISEHWWKTAVMPNLDAFHLLEPLVMFDSHRKSWRWRADDIYALFPERSPYPAGSTWLSRMKTKSKADGEAYLTPKQTEGVAVAA